MRDRGLEGIIETIVERQQGVPAEGDNDRLVLGREDRRLGLFRAGRKVSDRLPLLPFGDGLLIDSVTLGERSQARLTILYCSTDRLCRCGAPVQNLSP